MSELSHNFGFIEPYEPTLYREASEAERCFAELGNFDLAVAGFRRFVETFVDVALRALAVRGWSHEDSLFARMDRLRDTQFFSERVMGLLHEGRRLGNKGSHVGHRSCTARDAVEMMRLSRNLATAWLAKAHPDADIIRPAFRVPQTGNRAMDARNQRRAEAAEAAEAKQTKTEQAIAAAQAMRARLVVHQSLQGAYELLSEPHRASVTAALKALRLDPMAADWPHQVIPEAGDEKLRSVRVGDGLALVTAVPEQQDVVFALWAGSADAAREWAKGKRVAVHPVLGTVQLFDVDAALSAVDEPESVDISVAPLFEPFDDADLIRLGVPEPLLAAVRDVREESAFHRLAPLLPGEAGDALELLLVAESVEAVIAELALVDRQDAVDTSDFGLAVEHPGTQRSFRMLEPDEDLEAALNGSIEAWRLFLHPDQREMVQINAKGPVRVLGGAGTGKTVALLHRAAHLLNEVVPEGRIFVTTFTRNLALDLAQNLRKLVGPESMKRTTVWNLHRLARKVAQGGEFDGWEILQQDTETKLWDAACVFDTLGLDTAFYEAEWTDVVQAHGAVDEYAYTRAPRVGRGKPLGRKQRRAIWAVLSTFQRLKRERRLVEWPDLVRDACTRIEAGQWKSPFKAVLADEVQDFSPSDLRLLRALVPKGPNDLFLVGDAHQRIYGAKTSMRRCGIEIQGRSKRLRVNYRTTEEIHRWSVGVLEGLEFDDLDGGRDTLDGYRSLRSGSAPQIIAVATELEERARIVEVVEGWLEELPPEAICITARHRWQVRTYADLLRQHNHEVAVIGNETEPGAGIRVATMHRLKGLEFPCLLMGPSAGSGGSSTTKERSLVYVAATRARDELVVLTRPVAD